MYVSTVVYFSEPSLPSTFSSFISAPDNCSLVSLSILVIVSCLSGILLFVIVADLFVVAVFGINVGYLFVLLFPLYFQMYVGTTPSNNTLLLFNFCKNSNDSNSPDVILS